MAEAGAPLATYDETLAAVLAAAEPLGTETVALAAATGRVLAADLVAPFDLPRFDNTAVDGFAVHAADLERINRDGTAALALAMVIPAGESLRGRALGAGTTARVSTGSALPAGTAAVVMQEDVEVGDATVRIRAPLVSGQFIRRQGEEFRAGASVLRTPARLTPPACALAATVGRAQLPVFRIPRVGLVVSGSELISPGRPLEDAQVYDANTFGLAASLPFLGLTAAERRHATDTLASTREAFGELLDTCDVVLSSGGVSVGAFDPVKQALADLGVERRIWGVAIKPGKPFFFGVRRTAGRKTVVFGLPGNPLSALVTFVLFAAPYLRAVQGERAAAPPIAATLATPLRKSGRRTEFVPISLTTAAGVAHARPLDQRGSHMLGGLAQADALAMFPAERDTLAAGETVQCHPLLWSALRHG
jgi:molybdopterin molybdotransferase